MFDRLFEGRSWPDTTDRLGVMSVDSLNRGWELVVVESGSLVAKSKGGNAALLGRMCSRDDGKFCIEVIARAEIESGELRRFEFWHVDPADTQRHARQLDEAMQVRRNSGQRDGD